MGKLLPVLLVLLGLVAGGGAGWVLQPAAPADPHAAPAEDADHAAPAAPDEHAAAPPDAAPKADDGHGAKPPPDDGSVEVVSGSTEGHEAEGGVDYVKLSNQFVVPIVEAGQVASMMVVTLSLEVAAGGGDAVYAREPKLRDAFLQVLFDHANADGFRGRFTDPEAMMPLRRALREAAMKVLPDTVSDVLISDIVRHDS